jgi:DNA polymerase
MDIVTIDFETYYDKDYSLSKMTTEAYIRDPRFEVIGVSIKINDQEVDWYSGADPGGFLHALDYSNRAILCHNTAFDGAILSWKYNIKPKLWLDTLSMARPLHSMTVGGSLKALATYYKLGDKGDEVMRTMGLRRRDFTPEQMDAFAEYCIQDTNLTYRLFKKMARKFPAEELLVIDQTIRMYTEPKLVLDPVVLDAHLLAIHERKEKLLAKLGGEEKAKKFLMSNNKFADLLRAFGVEPPMKTSPTTGKQTYAFAKNDTQFTELLEHPNPAVRTVVEARLGTKSTIEETRTLRFLEISERGPLPIMLNYYGAHTGRFSGGDKVNLQNLPRGGQLRKALAAPDGHVVVACDSSQIEARLVAYLAGQSDLVQSFREGRDVYSEFATDVYQRPVSKADKVERHVGKTCILGLGYGMGAAKFQHSLATGFISVKVESHEAQQIVSLYRNKYHRIQAFWNRCNHALSALVAGESGEMCDLIPFDAEGVILPNGLRIQYPALRRSAHGFEYINDPRTYRKFIRARVMGDETPELTWTKIYGGKCLAGDTETLTDRGWVPLRDVTRAHRVWDGLAWVKHDGLIYQGKKVTTVVNGVRMTPDHNVLTERGWRCASSSEGLHRAGFWLPDGAEVSGDKWATLNMDLPVHLRDGSFAGGYQRGKVCPPWWAPVVRLQSWGREQVARYDGAPSLLGMAVHEGPLPSALAPSMEQLRGTGYQGMPTMGAVVHGVLDRHGAYVPYGADTGPQGQQWGLYPRELPLGDICGASGEPEEFATGGHHEGPQADGYFQIDAVVSVAPEPVYDLLNAGPDARFVVRGSTGPFIVHNCVENITQAVARIVVAEQMAKIGRRYPVALQVHDEVVCVVPEEQADACKEYMVKVMSTPPKWAPDLPVACEADVGLNYGDSK